MSGRWCLILGRGSSRGLTFAGGAEVAGFHPAHGEADEGGAIRQVEFFADAGAVDFDGFWRDAEAFGDFIGAQSGTEVFKNLEFSVA